MEGANRRFATVTAKPAAAALKLLEKSRSFFLPFCFFENSYNKNAAAGFETKWAFEKIRAVAQHFFLWGHRRCPQANEGAVEGADRRSATVTAKPAAAAFKLLEKSRSFFLPFCFFENSYNKNAAEGFETKWAFEKNASSGAAFFTMRAQEVPESERRRRRGSRQEVCDRNGKTFSICKDSRSVANLHMLL